jgi:hypothetical protein
MPWLKQIGFSKERHRKSTSLYDGFALNSSINSQDFFVKLSQGSPPLLYQPHLMGCTMAVETHHWKCRVRVKLHRGFESLLSVLSVLAAASYVAFLAQGTGLFFCTKCIYQAGNVVCQRWPRRREAF